MIIRNNLEINFVVHGRPMVLSPDKAGRFDFSESESLISKSIFIKFHSSPSLLFYNQQICLKLDELILMMDIFPLDFTVNGFKVNTETFWLSMISTHCKLSSQACIFHHIYCCTCKYFQMRF